MNIKSLLATLVVSLSLIALVNFDVIARSHGMDFTTELLRGETAVQHQMHGDRGNYEEYRISKKSTKRYRRKKYKSSAPAIPYTFRPKGKGPFPGVMLLHTSGGVKSHIVKFGRQLVGKGYVVVVVDYFTKGGVDNIDKGYDLLSKDKRVISDRIGIIGFSKGGDQGIKFIEYSHNFTERRVNAFVGHYIGPVIPSNDKLHPPMLFLHEDVVSHIAPDAVERYCELQKGFGTVCETHIYKGVHHGWDTNCSYCRYSSKATKDSFKRTVEFLDAHLKASPQPAKPQ